VTNQINRARIDLLFEKPLINLHNLNSFLITKTSNIPSMVLEHNNYL